MIEIPHHFNPRSYQRELFDARARGLKRFLTVWHRRAGKDKCWLNFIIAEMLKRKGSYYYILPTYAQAKKILWDGMDLEGFKFLDHIPRELIVSENKSDLQIEIVNGSIFQLLGSDNINRIVGVNPIGVVFSEWSLQDPQAWDLYRPILNENGGWAGFNGTPRGKGENPLWKLYQSVKDLPEWFTSVYGIDKTRRDALGEDGLPIVTVDMVEQDRREGLQEELIRQEYYCDFAGANVGSYYGNLVQQAEDDGRITDVPWNPRLPVFTVWDLGISDAMTVIFAQLDGIKVNLIDYIEKSGEGLSYFATEIKRKLYNYSNHHAPHDIQQRELTSGKSRLELARDLGLPFQIVKNISVQDGIDSLRSLFPRLWFDRTKCARLVSCLTNYHKQWDEKKKVYGKAPVHDWSSHGADAARYLSICYDEEYESRNLKITSTGTDERIFDSREDDEDVL